MAKRAHHNTRDSILTSPFRALSQAYLTRPVVQAGMASAIAVVSWPQAGLAWFAMALLWTPLRSRIDRARSEAMSDGLPTFQHAAVALAMVGCILGAIAPILAALGHHPAAPMVALLLLACSLHAGVRPFEGDLPVAAAVNAPYGCAAAFLLVHAFGTPWLAPTLVGLVVIMTHVWSHYVFGLSKVKVLRAYEVRQTELVGQLQAAVAVAEAADTAKTQFMGVVSHELRTPLNGILGAAQLVAMLPAVPDEARRYNQIIRGSGDVMLTLLNDLLDFAKLDADRMMIEAIEIDPLEVAERCLRTFEARAEEKGLRYGLDLVGDVPGVLLGDPTRLTQIINNLVSNAVKFTDAGAVRIALSCDSSDGAAVDLKLAVRDTGPGMSPEDLTKLFASFEQLGAATARQHGGSGLGLAISRRLARLMGGDITVASVLGEGTTFTFSARFSVQAWDRREQTLEPMADPRASGNPMRILAAEDHEVNRTILKAFLDILGHDVTFAENGAEAVELAARQGFDVILMDVNMPVMDGVEAIRLLRMPETVAAQTPIVMLSASASLADQEAGNAAGADGYLTKPIDIEKLARILEQARGGRVALREAA